MSKIIEMVDMWDWALHRAHLDYLLKLIRFDIDPAGKRCPCKACKVREAA